MAKNHRLTMSFTAKQYQGLTQLSKATHRSKNEIVRSILSSRMPKDTLDTTDKIKALNGERLKMSRVTNDIEKYRISITNLGNNLNQAVKNENKTGDTGSVKLDELKKLSKSVNGLKSVLLSLER